MRAIVIRQFGGPGVLSIEERPAPEPGPGQVLIEVKAFRLNHAEVYFRKGLWGDVAEISGIECVGLVKFDPDGRLPPGQKVAALVGGTPEFPLSEIPFQTIVDRVASGTYKARPARVFRFEQIQEAHRLMESNHAGGKIVVVL